MRKKGKFHKLRLLLTTHFAEMLAMLENILSAARYHLNVALHAEVTRCLYFRRVKLLINFPESANSFFTDFLQKKGYIKKEPSKKRALYGIDEA